MGRFAVRHELLHQRLQIGGRAAEAQLLTIPHQPRPLRGIARTHRDVTVIQRSQIAPLGGILFLAQLHFDVSAPTVIVDQQIRRSWAVYVGQ